MHVAIIMDGNGRWALRRGRPRSEGHRAGAQAVRRVVEAAPALGIGTLTLFCFSSANWQRPRAEVEALLALFRDFLHEHTATLAEHGIRLSVLGHRGRFTPELGQAVVESEAATSDGAHLHLRLAIDYSSRDAILEAARLLQGNGASRHSFARCLAGEEPGAADVDLLIRTGGEQRLSDFLLWECAYAELYFTRTPWPEFTAAELEVAVTDFHRRQRTFGRLPEVILV